jgi:hypothetical protein
MKSRSSTGVGQKIDLEYNIETMRITDPGEEGQDNTGGYRPASNILNQIKTGSTVTDARSWAKPQAREGFSLETPQPTPGSSVESHKLKQMLAGLKSKTD